MKGINLFLAACFIVPTIGGAMADVTKNTSRTNNTRAQQTSIGNTVRGVQSVKQRGAAPQTSSSPKGVVSRTTKNTDLTPKQNTSQPTRNISVAKRTTGNSTQTRRGTTTVSRSATRPGTVSRAATTKKTRESVINRNFSNCKSVFFDCMDEFCANKDAQLKRCACSNRQSEFKTTQKSLNNVENGILDFNQRLLKINMDPADAAAINQETEGEAA